MDRADRGGSGVAMTAPLTSDRETPPFARTPPVSVSPSCIPGRPGPPASVHWNQAANQMARANNLSLSDNNRLLAVVNLAMADTAITIWSSKRFYGSIPTEVTWRPVTSIPLADSDGNPETAADPEWLPLINAPSHPEYPAGHPSQNGAAATVLLSYFKRAPQAVTVATTRQPSRTYTSPPVARAARTR